MEIKYVEHTFMTSHTIRGAIRLHNKHTSDEVLLEKLMRCFCEVNNNEVPKVGRSYKIPVAVQHNE